MMKKHIFALSILTILSSPLSGQAEEASPFDNSNLNKEEKRIVASGKACEKAIKKARTDGADYVAGVDVRGKVVVSANVDGQNYDFDFPSIVEFDLSLNAFKAAGLDDLADLFPDSNFNLGRIKYNISSGKLTLNGKTLTDDQNVALSKACIEYQNLKSQE